MPEFRDICAQAALPPPEEIVPLRPGTVARVWRLRCGGRDYLLRTLQGPEQGERERTVLCHLRSVGFICAPEWLGQTEMDGVYYQLQEYINDGARPDLAAPGAAEAIAHTAKALTAALSDCPSVAGGDRFDLAPVWAEHRDGWDALRLGVPLAEADAAVARLAGLRDAETRVIHGDLGPWNLLRTSGGRIYVIDFGEARMGDPYFDLASALGGVINHCPGDMRAAVCRRFLAALDADGGRLLDQLRLWSWRGLAQCARAAKEGSDFTRFARRFWNALAVGKELLGGERIC